MSFAKEDSESGHITMGGGVCLLHTRITACRKFSVFLQDVIRDWQLAWIQMSGPAMRCSRYRPSCPLHEEGLKITQMVAAVENQLAHAQRKADDATCILVDQVRSLKQSLMEETLARFDILSFKEP